MIAPSYRAVFPILLRSCTSIAPLENFKFLTQAIVSTNPSSRSAGFILEACNDHLLSFNILGGSACVTVNESPGSSKIVAGDEAKIDSLFFDMSETAPPVM